jgi:hypothetical protein
VKNAAPWPQANADVPFSGIHWIQKKEPVASPFFASLRLRVRTCGQQFISVQAAWREARDNAAAIIGQTCLTR